MLVNKGLWRITSRILVRRTERRSREGSMTQTQKTSAKQYLFFFLSKKLCRVIFLLTSGPVKIVDHTKYRSTDESQRLEESYDAGAHRRPIERATAIHPGQLSRGTLTKTYFSEIFK